MSTVYIKDKKKKKNAILAIVAEKYAYSELIRDVTGLDDNEVTKYLCEELRDDGFVHLDRATTTRDSNSYGVRITTKGKVFISGGGYRIGFLPSAADFLARYRSDILALIAIIISIIALFKTGSD